MTQPITPPSERLLSLDVFRGLIIAAMILVTDPGTYSARYAPLCHADWNGPTFTDMIAPAFMVMIGMAIPYSFASRMSHGDRPARLLLHVFRRTIVLILIGLFINAFPHFHFATLRFPGILQRIALGYCGGASIYLGFGRLTRLTRINTIAAVTVGLLSGYWMLLKLTPVPGFGSGHLDSLGSLPAYVDRAVFTVPHLWAYGTTPGRGVTYDPDGLLSIVPSLADLLIGVIAGEWLRTTQSQLRKLGVLIISGVVLVASGLLLGPWMPLNKKIWTSTYALLSSGVAILIFAALYCMLDIKRWRALAAPALVFGTNAIFAFILSSIVTTLSDRIHIASLHAQPITLHKWAYQYLFATWLQPINASLAYATAIVLLNLALVYPLYRRRIFLRI